MSRIGVSRADRDSPDQPTRPISTRFQPEPTLSSVSFGFLRPRPNVGGSNGGFSSPKPEPPDLTEVIYKSGEIELKFEEIQQVLNHIWWDLARSGHSQQISTILRRGLAILMQIWWVYTFFGDNFADSDASSFFRCRWLLKLRQWPETDRQTQSPNEPKTESTDWRR